MAVDMLPTLTYFATLIGFGVLLMNFTKKSRIPDALFLVLLGLLFGPTVLNLVNVGNMGDVPAFLRTLALIIIVFAGAFHLKMSTFKRVSNISLKLSFGGFFFSFIVLGLLGHYIFNISWFGSFILSAIVGGTSSAAIMTFRGTLGEKNEIMDILTVESIFSDPLTVLVPILLLDAFISTSTITSTAVLSQFWQMIAAGVGTGVVIGFGAGKLITKIEQELTPLMSFAVALITYALASNVGGSGILAVAICAIILGNLEIPHKERIWAFEDSLSMMLTISIFTLLGAEVALSFQGGLLGKEILYIILLIFFARPVFTLVAFFKEGRSLSDLLLLSFTGPRGSATAAMAAIPLTYALKENIPGFLPEAELILITAFLVVLSTMAVGTLAGSIYSATHPSGEKKKEEKPSIEEEQDIIEELLEK